ncbi:hypothetical protein BS78_03G356200 [Paspalum vaginatum]|nr:hypothetical protein BS78_03G356200 [Paspalum vaginatum]
MDLCGVYCSIHLVLGNVSHSSVEIGQFEITRKLNLKYWILIFFDTFREIRDIVLLVIMVIGPKFQEEPHPCTRPRTRTPAFAFAFTPFNTPASVLTSRTAGSPVSRHLRPGQPRILRLHESTCFSIPRLARRSSCSDPRPLCQGGRAAPARIMHRQD